MKKKEKDKVSYEAAVPLAIPAIVGVAIAGDVLLKLGALFLSGLGLSYVGKKAVDNYKKDDSNTNEDLLEKQERVLKYLAEQRMLQPLKKINVKCLLINWRISKANCSTYCEIKNK